MTKDDKYLQSFGRTLSLMDEKIAKLYPLAAKGGVLKWGQQYHRALYGEITAGLREIEELMIEKADLEAFKARIIAWAQKHMKLCKKYQAWAKKKK